jgi:hypothetical protein
MDVWRLFFPETKTDWTQVAFVSLGLVGSLKTRSFVPFGASLAYLAWIDQLKIPLKKPVVVVPPSQAGARFLRESENTRAAFVPSTYAQIFGGRPVSANFEATKAQDEDLLNTREYAGPTKFVVRQY